MKVKEILNKIDPFNDQCIKVVGVGISGDAYYSNGHFYDKDSVEEERILKLTVRSLKVIGSTFVIWAD